MRKAKKQNKSPFNVAGNPIPHLVYKGKDKKDDKENKNKINYAGLISGTVVFKKNGYAFIGDDGGGRDIFVRTGDLGNSILGDSVLLKIVPDRSLYKKSEKKRRTSGSSISGSSDRSKPNKINKSEPDSKDRRGRVVKIIKRNLKSFKAIVDIQTNLAFLTPVSPEFSDKFVADLNKFKGRADLKSGDLVSVVLPESGDFSLRTASIESIIGDIESAGAEENIILSKYNLYDSFEHAILEELDKIPENIEEILDVERVDLRSLPFITIDGEDAKDFDDAVYLEQSDDSSVQKLFVAIADVSHFVKIGSIIDKEAFKRGNSTYFPGKVYPMLPEKLSNDLCSLLPRKSRFVFVCEMTIDEKGKITDTKVYKATIKTFDRLTYSEVYGYLNNLSHNRADENENENKNENENSSETEDDDFKKLDRKLSSIKGMLLNMKKLAIILRNKRKKAGGLDFDSLYGKVILGDKGETIDVIAEPRNFAHNMIEDFMITANTAVSMFIESKKIPSIYRVHESPDEDRVKEFLKMLKYFNLSVSYDSLRKPKDYQKMLDGLKKSEIASFLEQAFLRSMKIAVYSPVNIHHFGLAIKSYTHFTSPIRRYADLTVHRILNLIVDKSKSKSKSIPKSFPEWMDAESLKALSGHISKREKLSADAEREYAEFKKMQFLKQNEEKIFEGFITSVMNFGFFVDISGFFIQGFVHVSNIADDYYEFSEHSKILKGRHSKKVFKMGDKVSVSVNSINLIKREVDLRFIEFAQA